MIQLNFRSEQQIEQNFIKFSGILFNVQFFNTHRGKKGQTFKET